MKCFSSLQISISVYSFFSSDYTVLLSVSFLKIFKWHMYSTKHGVDAMQFFFLQGKGAS